MHLCFRMERIFHPSYLSSSPATLISMQIEIRKTNAQKWANCLDCAINYGIKENARNEKTTKYKNLLGVKAFWSPSPSVCEIQNLSSHFFRTALYILKNLCVKNSMCLLKVIDIQDSRVTGRRLKIFGGQIKLSMASRLGYRKILNFWPLMVLTLLKKTIFVRSLA